MHNGVARPYLSLGKGGAHREPREIDASRASRTWYRQDPPYRTVSWSQRNNNNYEETGLLVSLAFVAENRELLLRNFWEKSKRSIAKPEREGPAAYVLPAGDRRPGAQAELLRVLQLQHVEISRADKAFTVTVPSETKASEKSAEKSADKSAGKGAEKAPVPRTLPAGSYVVRMDQPFSRAADALLDRQYWSPDDPQKRPYDDTGWCFPALFDTEAVRVTDRQALSAALSRVEAPVRPRGGVSGSGSTFVIAQRGDDAMITLRFALGDAKVEAAADSFKAGGHDYRRGTGLVRGIATDALDRAAADAGVTVEAVADLPKLAARPVANPRTALRHAWLNAQTEGWWRQRLDLLKIPYDYISTQKVAADANLASRYDVILFPPVGFGDPQRIVIGMPTAWGEPMPWKTTPETPNLGKIDSTDDQRPGLGYAGLDHLRQFVEQGGLLVAVEDTARLMIQAGLAPGVRVASPKGLKVVGTVLDARFPDATSPIADGLGDRLSAHSADGLSFEISNSAAGGWQQEEEDRPTGRGGPKDTEEPQGRPAQPPPPTPAKVERWEARPLRTEELRNNPAVIPEALRPRTLLRFGDADDLLVSGLLEHGDQLARRAAVVEVPLGKGHLLLFAINPIWRGSTIGSHPLVWNAILQHGGAAGTAH